MKNYNISGVCECGSTTYWEYDGCGNVRRSVWYIDSAWFSAESSWEEEPSSPSTTGRWCCRCGQEMKKR